MINCIPFLFLSLSADNLGTLYNTLDPTSVSQSLAFYELYPNTKEGKASLRHAWDLLSGSNLDIDPAPLLPTLDVSSMIALVNRSSQEETPILNDPQLDLIDILGKSLHNRSLKGYGLWSEQEILSLDPDEIDLGRGLLLAELGPAQKNRIRSYEGTLDFMALQILARLKKEASPSQKIRAINDYIFTEMQFRFPPHSLHAEEIDLYTFLPSVLDGRKGVCLGVSILFHCLAQRIDLKLESVTPPGHIYVRHRNDQGDIINVETTARGIDPPSELFLGVETKSLQLRNLREVIGLAFMNQAAVKWQNNDPEGALTLYQKARPYMGDDYLLNLFMGINFLFTGKEKEGKELLQKVRGKIPDHAICSDTVSEDYLLGITDIEGIQAVFSEVDETRESILKKRERLQKVITKYPKFRQGIFHLAITYLQMGREKDALPYLEKYTRLNGNDPTVNYYLSAIHFQRHNWNESWKYLEKAEEIVHRVNHKPRALVQLRKSLERLCPK